MSNRSRILAYVAEHMREHGTPPTIREIAAGCGLASTSSVAHHLRRLAKDGLIERSPDGSARGIRLTGARFVMPGDLVRVEVDGVVRQGEFVA